jgi:rfaE bifunctional protein nucleotidyltransferase chain/domain
MKPEDLAMELEARRREEDLTVALANGCFDLLHPGHIAFLQGAAAEADILVVGINSDDTVRELKGPGRPIMGAADRARLVTALRVVDYATIFTEPTADCLIELLRPNVHCKGTDYSSGVPEETTAHRVGARTVLVGGPKIHNTSDILHTIQEED